MLEVPPSAPPLPPELRAPELAPSTPAEFHTTPPISGPSPEELTPIKALPELTAEEKEVVYDSTIEEEPPVRVAPGPSFVAVEDYKRIITDSNTVRSKLMAAEKFVRRLSDLKNEEERAFEKWKKQLEDVEKKLTYVDQLIAEAQR